MKMRSGTSLRAALVIFQFATVAIADHCTFVIYRQNPFMQNHEMGLNLKHMIIIRGPRILEDDSLKTRLTTFKNQIKALPFCKSCFYVHGQYLVGAW